MGVSGLQSLRERGCAIQTRKTRHANGRSQSGFIPSGFQYPAACGGNMAAHKLRWKGGKGESRRYGPICGPAIGLSGGSDTGYL